MKKKEVVNNKNDLKVTKGDFVSEREGEYFNNVYKAEDILGEGITFNIKLMQSIGSYGKVQKCYHKVTREVRAVKIMDKRNMDAKEKVRLKYEIDILKNLDHPNIVKLFEVFEDKHFIYLVTELCSGGELFDEIVARKHFTEKDAASVIK